MITRDQAFSADVFHEQLGDSLPCTMWHRGGFSHAMHADAAMPGWLTDNTGGFFVPVFRNVADPESLHRDSQTQWHHITGASAADFHVADECPRIRRMSDDQPPIGTVLSLSDRSEDGRDANGYDAWGFDVNGYDADGYDSGGYDADGYDRDGYDAQDRNADGDPRPGSLDAGELDLADLWQEFQPRSSRNFHAGQNYFREHLRKLVSDPDEIDSLAFCDNCNEPGWNEDMSSVQGGDASVCESCWDDMVTCDSCEERFADGDISSTLSGSGVCENCRASYYSWCDDCDGYYPDNDAGEHEHNSGDDCCEVLATTFSVRNDGEDPLKNDTRITVTLPAGAISAEGMQAITRYLRDQGHFDVSYDLAELGDQWQTKGGNYTKRLSRLAYQRYQAKMTQDVLSTVGTIARNHSTAVDVAIEVTRELNMPAYEFYHEDSCWWGSYGESRCALKTNGGFGLRSFNEHGGVSGRAWVMPLRKDEHGKLVPTFETMTPDAFVVFNGYGDLSGYAPARIIAHMAGWTYRKIEFSGDPMYVNAGGYLIASEDIAAPYTDGGLYLSLRQHSRLFETERELASA